MVLCHSQKINGVLRCQCFRMTIYHQGFNYTKLNQQINKSEKKKNVLVLYQLVAAVEGLLTA